MYQKFALWSLVLFLVLSCGRPAGAEDQPDATAEPAADAAAHGPDQPMKDVPEETAKSAEPEVRLKSLTRLSPTEAVWIDPMRKIVVVDGKVSLRRGVLELFACLRGTKEHESIVSVNAKASTIHTGLLAVGAMQGKPVRFIPEYKPATGTEVEVWVLWKDTDGANQKAPAQHWVRNIKTSKAMTENWVFGGSGFYVDERTGERFYQADGSGELLCVSNFSTATLDLPIKSSAEAADLLFEAFTERIPARGTHVRLVFIPRKSAASDDADKSDAE